jgi:hypothetical protein
VRNSEQSLLGFSLSVWNWNENLGVNIVHYKIEYFPKGIETKLVLICHVQSICYSTWNPIFGKTPFYPILGAFLW